MNRLIGMENEEKTSFMKQLRQFYERKYKVLPVIPLILAVVSILIIVNFYNAHGDIFEKDVSLKGGITTTVLTENPIDLVILQTQLTSKFGDANVRRITEFGTDRQIGITAEVATEEETVLKQELEKELQMSLNEENYSVEIMGSTLGNAFYKQMLTAIGIAFLLITLVVAFMYRSFIPCMDIMLSIVGDILVAVALVDLFDIRISTTGISAFLLLIGYSIDNNILLSTRALKRKESNLMDRVFSSLNTGLTMTITALVAIISGLIVSESQVIQEMFIILLFGLCADIIITYCMNAPTIIRYAKSKGIQ